MPTAFNFAIYSPLPLSSSQGNAVSARRIAGLLQKAGWDAAAMDSPPEREYSVLVVLNAWRSHQVLASYKRRFPRAATAVLLTGTDIYPDLLSNPDAMASLELADALVGWQAAVRDVLPEALRHKYTAIPKSVPDAPDWTAEPGESQNVLVIAHLREVKDPFRAAAAVMTLPPQNPVSVLGIGSVREEKFTQLARHWESESPRYRWLGECSREEVWKLLRNAWLTVNSSFLEGGANAVLESVVAGVPVLASQIQGNTGLLGTEYPGYFPAGDTRALQTLLLKCQNEPDFYATLRDAVLTLRDSLSPDREQEGWIKLLSQLGRRE